MAIVYQHIRKDNRQVFYVGIGTSQKRAKERYGRNFHWQNIVNKYGYDIEITHKDICWEDACKIEQYLISFYGRIDLKTGCLVNMTDGGDGVANPVKTEEAKEKWRLKVKGVKRPILDPIKRELASKRSRERFLGKHIPNPRSEEYKEKMSKAKKGKSLPPVSDETRLRLSIANKGKKRSAGTKEKMKISNKRPHSEETKRKISEIKRLKHYVDCLMGVKKVKEYTKPTPRKHVLNLDSGIFYDSAKDASDIFGHKHSTLKSMLNGYRKNRTNLIYV